MNFIWFTVKSQRTFARKFFKPITTSPVRALLVLKIGLYSMSKYKILGLTW